MKSFEYNKFYSSINEWINSIYSYNKNQILYTIYKNKITYILLNGYFNMKPLKKKVRFSLKRIFVSIPEIKHKIGNAIHITVYIFNKEMLYILKKIYQLRSYMKNFKFKSNPELKTFKKKYSVTKNKKYLLKKIKFNKKIKLNKNIIINKPNELSTLNNKNEFNKYNDNYSLLLEKILEKKLYRLYLYKYYVSKLFFNVFKFSVLSLLNLKKILSKVYGKKIYINIVNVKYLYMDNSIYINAIVRKLRNRKRKVLKVIRKARNLVKLNRLHFFNLEHFKVFLLVSYNYYDLIKYKFNDFLYKKVKFMDIYRTIKNSLIVGVKIEAKGRLTKRLTASRSVHKIALKGNLKNIYSSIQGKSALLTKGFQKSSIEYINRNYYNRMGSFGIKTYINTY